MVYYTCVSWFVQIKHIVYTSPLYLFQEWQVSILPPRVPMLKNRNVFSSCLSENVKSRRILKGHRVTVPDRRSSYGEEPKAECAERWICERRIHIGRKSHWRTMLKVQCTFKTFDFRSFDTLCSVVVKRFMNNDLKCVNGVCCCVSVGRQNGSSSRHTAVTACHPRRPTPDSARRRRQRQRSRELIHFSTFRKRHKFLKSSNEKFIVVLLSVSTSVSRVVSFPGK